jgi:hypothetical protein
MTDGSWMVDKEELGYSSLSTFVSCIFFCDGWPTRLVGWNVVYF